MATVQSGGVGGSVDKLAVGDNRLSRLSGEFRDPSREQQFQRAAWPRTRSLIRATVATTGILVVVGFCVDLLTFDLEDDRFWLLVACRAAVLSFAAIPLGLAARAEFQPTHRAAATAYLWVLFAMVLIVAEVRGGRGGLLIFFLAVLCVAVAQFFLVRASFITSLSSALLMTVGALTYVGAKGEFAPTEYLVLAFLILVGNGLAAFLAAEINGTLREGYLWLDNERAQIARLRAEVARRATAEAAAREGRDQLGEALAISRAVHDVTPAAFVAVDGRGRVIAWNDAFLRLWGVTTEDLSGLSAMRLREVLTAGLDPASRDALLTVADSGEAAPDLTLADGRRVAQWVRDFSTVSVGKGKAWFFWDVTSRRRSADVAVRDMQAWEASSRAKSALLDTIGHDLVALVDRLGPLEHASAPGQGGGGRADRDEGVGMAIRALHATLATLLRERPPETTLADRPMESFDIVAALQEITSRRVADGHALVVTLAADFPRLVHGDEAGSRQVLSGLIDRALTRRGEGPIQVEALVLEREEARLWLGFDVTVGGQGGSPAGSPTPDPGDAPGGAPGGAPTTRPGTTDFGLSLVRRLADMLGGTLERRDQDDGFRVRLSLPFAAVRPDTPVPLGDAPPPPRSLSLLIAEDDEINQRLLVTILEGRGHQVTAVADGAQAVAAARLGGYDAAILDVRMPSLDGIEAARLIRAFPGPERTLPLLGVTANISPQSREACLSAGMDAVLVKPYSADELIAQLDHLTTPADATRQP